MDVLENLSPKKIPALSNRRGQTIVEYALIIALIVIVVIVSLNGIGQHVNNSFCSVVSEFK